MMNETFKTNQQVIEIEATATEVINTKVVFWSHDKGTARLKFQLKKEGAIFPLTEGTIVPICLLFKSESAADGIGRHIYNATIDDAVNGLISFIFPDNILGYQGIVDGSIYIDMPNKQSLDTAGRFTFNIRRSPIDDIVPELEDYYYAGFNAVDQRIKDTLAKIETIETDFVKEMNAMQSKLNKFESDSKLQMDNIQQQITDKELYTKKETDDKFVPKTQTANATQAGILKVIHGLTSTDQLSALSAAAGKSLDDKIRNIPINLSTSKPASDLPATYQNGITIFDGKNDGGYPISYSSVLTVKVNNSRIFQITFPKSLNNANASVTDIYIRGLGAIDTEWGTWETMLTSKSIVDNLSSEFINRPLSAGMGKLLKDSMVNITDNQTVGGIKNFSAGLLSEGNTVLTNKRVNYRYDGSGQADAAVKSSIDGTQTYIEMSRIGDIVYIRGRINLTASTASVLRAKFFDIPAGYRCDFNNAVSWSKYGATNPECVAIAERDGLYFMGNQPGNYYFTQSWFTTDAMPN